VNALPNALNQLSQNNLAAAVYDDGSDGRSNQHQELGQQEGAVSLLCDELAGLL
jgi:hypothetical protein